MSKFSTTIPCKPLVRLWVERSCSESKRKVNKHIITKKTQIGKYFFTLVEKPSQKEDSKYRNQYYTDSVLLYITEDLLLRDGIVLTKTGIISFNSFVTKNFYETLHTYVKARKRSLPDAINEYQIIDEFLLDYDITEEHVKYETIYRMYRKYKNKSAIR